MDLFSSLDSENNESIVRNIVPGLIYIENYISTNQHDLLLDEVYKCKWSSELKRRVQHYGYKYDYRTRNIHLGMRVESLPSWAIAISQKLVNDSYFSFLPDQLIINEYLPGQGIADHIDCEPCFEDTVVSISLGSYAIMNFTHKITKEKIPVILQPRSAVILKGESRYNWMHGIPARKSDKIKGVKKERTRRVSLTYRRVILN